MLLQDASSDNALYFKDRKIDLRPYLKGFPFSNFTASYDANQLFYMKRGQTTKLQALGLNGRPDLEQGKTISDLDYSKRNVWGIRYNKKDQHLYWIGDKRNDEVINLMRLNPRTGQLEKLTDVPYIFGWRWNKTQDKVAYVTRLGDKENRLGELRILNLESKEESKVIQDQPAMRYTWGAPSWQPEGKGIVLPALKNADRAWSNLVYIDLERQTQTLLTDPTKKRSFPSIYSQWINSNEFLWFSNEDGFRNAYIYNLSNQQSRALTTFKQDLGNAQMIEIEEEPFLFATTSNPIENQLYLIDLKTGQIIHQKPVETQINVLDSKANKLLVRSTSNASMFEILELTVEKNAFIFQTKIALAADLQDKIYQAIPERVSYPTFDIDDQTGERRKLHAYLYRPKNPLPKDQQLVMIQSFYGGGNSFSARTQILAEAGIYVFSPSPRGSAGFGREFAALNDKDLGGNEIIDIYYAAKYISEKLDIPPERIGVYGGSHGGYATMRVLTFPGEINGNTVDFDWGFGLSHAGFSDIIHFYENCNIPDWVTLEAGNPKVEITKLKDRSPLYHANKLRGKLLLTHGTNDSRVPIAGSRMMADSLKKYGKDAQLVEFKGQGHSIKGLANSNRFYRAWFEFLETIPTETEKEIPN